MIHVNIYIYICILEYFHILLILVELVLRALWFLFWFDLLLTGPVALYGNQFSAYELFFWFMKDPTNR